MKFRYALITAIAALLLCTGPARAGTVDFVGHDGGGKYSDRDTDYFKTDQDKKGDDDRSWSGDKKSDYDDKDDKGGKKDSWKDFGDSDKGDKYPHSEETLWSHNKDWDGDHDWKGTKDHVPPPLCTVGDPGHDGGDKDKHWRDVDYFKDICDKHKHGHGHICDPGDRGNPTPLPGALPMFAAGLLLLFMRKRIHGKFAK